MTRRAAQRASHFHDAAKILLTASPVWTLMTTAVERPRLDQIENLTGQTKNAVRGWKTGSPAEFFKMQCLGSGEKQTFLDFDFFGSIKRKFVRFSFPQGES
jgi:hypothetical protein